MLLHLDIETTGFSKQYDDILSVSIVTPKLEVLLNTLVKPILKSSWPKAQEVHHISPRDVINAPSLETVIDAAVEIIGSNDVCSYNAEFDFGHLGKHIAFYPETIHCCMNRFARYMGEPSTAHYHKTGFRTHKLVVAAKVTGYPYAQGDKLHDACTDAKICAWVWNWLDEKSFPV